MVARLAIDRSAERFGAAVTIADLAVHSFTWLDSHHAHVYEIWETLERDWPFEFDRSLSAMEYGCGVHARFKDGSALNIGAHADCCDGTGCRECCGQVNA